MRASPLVIGLLAIVATAAFAFATQGGNPQPSVTIKSLDGYIYIDSNGIPNHPTGRFPNRNNPNSISAQNYHFRVPASPKPAASPTPENGRPFGVAVNGVPYDPGTAEFWNNDPAWKYEALGGYVMTNRGGLGVDENLAHVQPNGAYHYHGLPMGLLTKLDYTKKMVLVGYAADGFPLYGPYAYKDAKSATSPLSKMRSSYRLKAGSRSSGPGGAFDGSFASDYEFVKGLGDLDEFNGREGVTPEYPKGTYYYVVTESFPYLSRDYRGTPDPSFNRGGPGGPGGGPPRGPGGGPPPRGGPPRGGPPRGGPPPQ